MIDVKIIADPAVMCLDIGIELRHDIIFNKIDRINWTCIHHSYCADNLQSPTRKRF